MGFLGESRDDAPMDSRVQRFKTRAGRALCGAQNLGRRFQPAENVIT